MTIQSPSIERALAEAHAALSRREFPRAAQIAENLGTHHPDLAEAWFILGVALFETGHAGHALGRIERAVSLEPGNAQYLAQQARLLVLLRREDEARAAADAATRADSQDPLVLDTIGCVQARLGDHAAAVALFERAVAGRPDSIAFRFNLAASLSFFGRVAEAEAQYEAMIALDPANGLAHYGIAGLRRQTGDANHLERIERAIPKAHDHDNRVRLHYAAAKEYEDVGQPGQSFAHLDAANRAHKARIGYSFERDAALAAALEGAFARPDYFGGEGYGDAAPIFITGLPRTGTTLVDRILDAHPAVTSLGELQAMPLAVKRLSGTKSRLVLDADTIAAAGTLSPRAVGEAYVTHAAMQAGASAALGEGRIIVDKFPLNFLYIGHIARALPNAKIVCLRRQPLDSVWSNFKHLFALNSPYYGWSYDLLDTARYYILFDRMMGMWRRQMPGRVLELGYEDLTADPEGQTRTLLAHCGLPWDDACLDFHGRSGAVATPSAQQVRRPVNRDSVDRWRAYAEHLGEVQAVLAEAGLDPGA